MKVKIINDGRYLNIYFDGHLLLLNKTQILSVKPCGNDRLHIDAGRGPLDQLYVQVADVVEPVVGTVEELLGAINVMLNGSQDPLVDLMHAVDSLGNKLDTIDTSILDASSLEHRSLNDITTLLTDVKAILDGANNAYKEPLRIDEIDPTVVYKGFPSDVSAGPGEPAWAIQRAKKSGGVTTICWANGNKDFTNVWDHRTSLLYLPG